MRQTDTAKRPARAWDAFGPGALDRLEFILLLTALLAVVLLYPLRLQDAWLSQLNGYWERGATFWARFTGAQLEAFCNFYFSPLLFKGVLALVPLLAFTAVRAARWAFSPREQRAAGGWAWVSVAAFFGWAALSALWSPTPAVSRIAALWVLLFGSFLFALLRRGLRPREAGCLARALVAMGAVVMLIAFLQSAPLFREKIFLFMNRFTDLRNRYGSLLGHNTAAASYLMMTLFPCFALLLASWRPLVRVQYGLYLAAALFMILVLQSRAVWGLTPVLGFLAVRSALRGARREGRIRVPRWLALVLVGALAFGLLSQIVDHPKNPFYVRDNPLARRLKAVTVSGLMNDARVRLNIISATLVPAHPIKGHGLFAYQYIYPRRQAEFFAAHPASALNQSVARSNMAHNEYMQVLVDHGAIGLGLLLWVLGEIAVRGWRRRRQLEGSERLLHEALGWSGLAFALHSGFDFPFHIPQLAVPGILCLAGWGSFLLPGARATSPASASGAQSAEDVSPDAPAAPVSGLASWPWARPAAALLILLALPLATFPLVRALQADALSIRAEAFRMQFAQDDDQARRMRDGLAAQSGMLVQAIGADGRLAPAARQACYLQACQIMETLKPLAELTPELKGDLMKRVADLVNALVRANADPRTSLAAGERLFDQIKLFREYSISERLKTLNQSVMDYRRALELAPYNEMMRYNLAATYLHLGNVMAAQAQRSPTGQILLDGPAIGRARDYLNQGLAALQQAQRGIDFHWPYWLRSQLCARMIDLLPPGESAAQYKALYEKNVAAALFYSPHTDLFIDAGLDIEESRPAPNAARVEELQRRLHRIAPETFNTRYFNPTMEGLRQQRYAWAARRLDWLLTFDPANSLWLNHAARAHLLAGNRARSKELVKRILELDAYSLLTDGGALPMHVLQLNWRQLLRWFRISLKSDPRDAAEFRALELEAAARLSPKVLAGISYSADRPIYSAPPGVDAASWRRLVAEALPGVRLHYFDEPERARQALEERVAMGGAQPPPSFWIEGCYIALALKDQTLLERCRAQLRLLKADGAPALADLGLAPPPAPAKP